MADVSFISWVLVLPARGRRRAPGPAELVLLVKPQFEVGRQRVGKGGVVRDPQAHVDAITAVLTAAESLGWQGCGVVASPITGPAGNHEYLLWLRRPAGQAPHSCAVDMALSTEGGDRLVALRRPALEILVQGTLG